MSAVHILGGHEVAQPYADRTYGDARRIMQAKQHVDAHAGE
jgi:hypothetical protein